MKKYLLSVLALLSVAFSFAQNGTTKWNASIGPRNVFIENKGQFNALTKDAGNTILYGTDGGINVILFTKNGLAYRMKEHHSKREDEREEMARKKGGNKKQDDDAEDENRSAVVQMEWVGANAGVQVVAEDKMPDYYNYHISGKCISNASAFQKITYKNLYNNIDVVYTFHEGTGIEYSLILHPGADVSQVKMRYSDPEKFSVSEKGEIHLPTIFGDIIDHAPLTYYENNRAKTISSSFVLGNGQVTFKLGSYDNTQTVVIDPWTTTPTLPTGNIAYYIKADSIGDAYIYGGASPFTLVKYSAAGSLIWTYSTTWDESSDWFGALAVDRTGNAYITNGDGATLAKINPAGGLVWSNTSGNSLSLSMEFWNLDFNCDQTELYVGGMRGPFTIDPVGVWYGVVNQMNLTNGTISNYTEVSIVPHTGGEAINEVRSLCMSPNGNIYCLSLDTLASLTQALAFNYREMQAYNYDYYLPYSPGGGQGQGSNNIRATSYFLYTTDGVTLDKRDINTGNILATTTIPGGSSQLNSGVAIDTCGNVYVGSQNQVVKYDANLNLLGTAATAGPVYDVSIGVNGAVLACGSTFAASLAFSACPQVLPICYKIFTANLTPAPPPCLGQCSGHASAGTTNGTGPYKYLWSNSATTATVNNLCPGSYSVTVTDLSNNSTAVAYTSIDSATAFITNVVTYPPSCGQTNGKAVAEIITGGSTPFTYAWSGGANQGVDSNLAPGPYSVTVTDAHGCSASASATLTQSSALSLAPASTETACAGNSGTASVAVTGAPGPFQYNWSNGQTSDTIRGLATGTYNVTVQDTSAGTSVFWSEYFTSGGTNWTLNNTGTAPNGNSANQWIVNNDATCNCTSGNYLHITNTTSTSCLECIIMPAGTCQYLEFPSALGEGDFQTDVLAISPVISTVGKTNITLGFTWESLGTPGSDYGLVDLSSDGGLHWTALPTQYDNVSTCTYASISIPSNYQNITNFRIAFEWINGVGSLTGGTGNPPGFAVDSITLTAGSSNCPATASVTIGSTSNFSLTPNAIGATCGISNGTASVATTGGSNYSYNWSNGATTDTISELVGGTYTVTVSASGGCSATASAVVSSTFGVTLSPVITNTTCNVNNGSADAGVSSGSGPFTYLWSNGGTTAHISNLAPGTYSVIVQGAGGCEAKATVVVDSSSNITLAATGGSVACGGGGGASVSVTTGTGPYSYSWSNGATTAGLSGVGVGNYSVTVTTALGCSASATATVSSSGSSVVFSASSLPTNCGNDIGAVNINITSGTPPYTYSWSNGATTDSLRNLAGGSYTVTVTGSNGCTATADAAVSVSGTLLINTSVVNTTCGNANGSASVTTTSGSYTYIWSNGATTSTISNLASGTYTVTVNALSGCNATSSVVINPSGGAVTITPSASAICQGDTSTICAPSGYNSYLWNVGETSSCIDAISSGNYYVTVTDNANCTAVSNHVTITVNAPPAVTITLHGGDTLVATGAVSYQWYNGTTLIAGATSSIYVVTQDGTYSASGTDGNGCTSKSNSENIKIVLGIAQVIADGNIKVYPNPLANGSWHVDVSDDWIGSNCDIVDEAGRVIYHTQLKGSQSEIEVNVAQGVYLMRISSGQKNYTVKLIKL
jgi:hypothetical protein